jgi:hypothetical protein
MNTGTTSTHNTVLTQEMLDDMMKMLKDNVGTPPEHIVANPCAQYDASMTLQQAQDKGLLPYNVHLSHYIEKDVAYIIPEEYAVPKLAPQYMDFSLGYTRELFPIIKEDDDETI